MLQTIFAILTWLFLVNISVYGCLVLTGAFVFLFTHGTRPRWYIAVMQIALRFIGWKR
jgi:hypothetical protein